MLKNYISTLHLQKLELKNFDCKIVYNLKVIDGMLFEEIKFQFLKTMVPCAHLAFSWSEDQK